MGVLAKRINTILAILNETKLDGEKAQLCQQFKGYLENLKQWAGTIETGDSKNNLLYYLCELYVVASKHRKQIYKNLSRNNSRQSYFRSYFKNSKSDIYYATLKSQTSELIVDICKLSEVLVDIPLPDTMYPYLVECAKQLPGNFLDSASYNLFPKQLEMEKVSNSEEPHDEFQTHELTIMRYVRMILIMKGLKNTEKELKNSELAEDITLTGLLWGSTGYFLGGGFLLALVTVSALVVKLSPDDKEFKDIPKEHREFYAQYASSLRDLKLSVDTFAEATLNDQVDELTMNEPSMNT